MHMNTAFAAALALASQSSAQLYLGSLSTDDAPQIRRSTNYVEPQVHDEDKVYHILSGRQSADTDTGTTQLVPMNSDGVMDWGAWDNATGIACMEALSKLDAASNPSGTGTCYNLPFLDRTTGTFEADLRLYKVSEPSGRWADIPPQDIEVSLAFRGSAASPVEATSITGGGRPSRAKRQSSNGANIELLQTYMFVGQVDTDHMDDEMTSAKFEALVMPVLTLTTVTAAGDRVSTNVSSNEAAFLTGIFSDEENLSEFALAQRVIANLTDGLENGQVAFVLPGVQIMIFPVGMIITGVWMIIGFLAYGFGTYERITYAESFKKRTAVAGNTRRQI